MIRSALYRRACWVLSMTAILFAAVGLHVIHPAVEEALAAHGAACCVHFPPNHAPGKSESSTSPGSAPTDAPRHGHAGCPVCMLLAAFHADAPGPSVVVAVATSCDVAPVLDVPEVSRLPLISFLGPRGPPAVLLSVSL
jgi:hypothetical protein